ncbi:hypothetical protein Agabi119p4_8526 [Agaricus bisporus var. burnettii]|uniref:DUF7729 domain-containing protein n=1 Tax=Agaricus bisporus var. burnettii TaxID=192524 RepID=A0A8H7C792_AGABI|nr:hypothetical protein Agabi119p4_8526 [Agaricus bisporus var. burnettii]
MFTPPPSPRPTGPKQAESSGTCTSSATLAPPPVSFAMSSHDRKRRAGRQFRWAVLIVPLVLIIITLSSRYVTHPAAFDIFSSPSSEDWSQLLENGKGWHLHKRHPFPGFEDDNNVPLSSIVAPPLPTSAVPSGSAAPDPSPALTTPQAIPTVPSAPPTLPTPFPQAYDQHFTLNFTSPSCLTFFKNMTNSPAFRKCRPFSLLSQSSSAFIDAQSNYTLMNTLLWGTCNIDLGVNQCRANMGWLAESLQQECEMDLNDRNDLALDALTAMNAYQLMYDAACMSNPSTNTYCYIEALVKTGSPDLYLYQLPFGPSLPSNVTGLTCSPCSKSVLNLYSSALNNETTADNMKGLQQTYDRAVGKVNQVCGNDFAVIVDGAVSTASLSYGLLSVSAVVLAIWTLII